MNQTIEVVIPHHNNLSRLQACLDSILETTDENVSIIIVANNQDENTLESAKKLGVNKRVTVLAIQENLGYAKAVNVGVEATKSSLVVVCDDDTRCMPGWLDYHIDEHKKDLKIAVTGSMLIDPETGRIWSVVIGVAGSTLNHPFRGRKPEFDLLSQPRHVQIVCSALMVINKEIWQSLGGLDEELPYYFSDPDYCVRATSTGYKCVALPESKAFHGGSGSGWSRNGKREDQKAYYYAKNANVHQDDLEKYLNEQTAFYLEKHKLLPEYVVLNLSTCVDWKRYLTSIEKQSKLTNHYNFQVTNRDMDKLALFDLIGYPIACFRQPLLYFVDVYYALRDNVMWQRLREGMGDLVVDRQTNIILLDELQACCP